MAVIGCRGGPSLGVLVLAKIDSFESFWPITSKRRYESFWFFAWSCVSIWLRWPPKIICRENSDMAKFWPFKTKIWPFFGQNLQFWKFLTYNFQTPLRIFLIFGMEVFLWSSLRKSYSICLENSVLAKFWPLMKIWPFFGQIDCFESFWPITSKHRYESS